MKKPCVVIKVPREVKIGAHTYRVWFDEREEDGDYKGSTLFRKREILLNPVIHKQDLRITYLHEVLHAVTDAYNQKVPEEAIGVIAQAMGAWLYGDLGIDVDFSNIPHRQVQGRITE